MRRKHPRLIRQKEWHIAPIASILQPRQQPISDLVLIRPGKLLQRLRRPAEQSTVVRQIFRPSRQRHLRSPLISRISGSAHDMRRRGRLPSSGIRPQPPDHVVSLQRQCQLRRSIPSRITVEDVLLTIRRRSNWLQAQLRVVSLAPNRNPADSAPHLDDPVQQSS